MPQHSSTLATPRSWFSAFSSSQVSLWKIMAKLFLSYLPCNIFKCLRLDSFCKSCRRQDTFFHFSITNPFRAKCLLNTCAIKPPVHFLSTTDLLPIKTLKCSLTEFFSSGTIGFLACFWFVRKIYSVVKVD